MGAEGLSPVLSGEAWYVIEYEVYELAIGARFVFRGRRFEKIAMSMANDEENCGNIFLDATEVEPEGVPLLLPPEEAARWKPDERPWTDYLTPAPGQR